MAKYVPDVKTQRWVVISPGRTKRPDDRATHSDACVFCPGSEAATPPEVYRIGPGEKDKPGWEVRVVPNKYPITDVHEVIIHSPDHEKDIEKLPVDHVAKILIAYRDRYRAHEADGQVMIFCNHGGHAGASLTHPHSQLVVVPRQINLDALSREPVNNIIDENTIFTSYCPDFSQWPFETWIVPHPPSGGEGGKFSDLTDSQLPDLAVVLQKALGRIESVYQDPSFSHIHGGNLFGYNFYISHGGNWFIRIIPRFIHRAGFELGTGLNVNIVDPTKAAEILRGALLLQPQ